MDFTNDGPLMVLLFLATGFIGWGFGTLLMLGIRKIDRDRRRKQAAHKK